MTKFIKHRQPHTGNYDPLQAAETCVAAIKGMIRQVISRTSGDANFEADIEKSLNIALADVSRWHLLIGSKMGRLEIIAPESKLGDDY